jgi:hypothetical protein
MEQKNNSRVKVLLTALVAVILISIAAIVIMIWKPSNGGNSIFENIFSSAPTATPDSNKYVLPEGVTAGRHCADIDLDGETVNVCTTCGDGKCEEQEACGKIVTGRSYSPDDCGPLFCPGDCNPS